MQKFNKQNKRICLKSVKNKVKNNKKLKFLQFFKNMPKMLDKRRGERWHGQARAGTQIYLRGAGLRLRCFRTPIWWLLLCFWAKGLHCCCKPNCFGAISTAFLFIFSVSGSVFILFFLVMLKVKCCIFTFNV